MKEGWTLDRAKFYGFDYENIGVEEARHSDLAVLGESDIKEINIDREINAREAFEMFAEGKMHEENAAAWPPGHGFPGEREERRSPDRRPPARPTPPRPPREEHRHNPGQNHHPGSAPRFAPPSYVPKASPALRAVDPGAIGGCLYSFVYLWLNNSQEFWFFPTFVGRRSMAGYRWMHNRWVYMGFDLRMVDAFFCGGR